MSDSYLIAQWVLEATKNTDTPICEFIERYFDVQEDRELILTACFDLFYAKLQQAN
jgi:hypothetical protein